MVDLNFHTASIHKSGSAGTILLNPENVKRMMNSNRQSPSKVKKSVRIPGKKNKASKQIFQTSDRISYNFNKIDPFSTRTKKSITESIREAQKNKDNKPLERKFIQANNYYLHNYMMGSANTKNSLMRFRLDEILKEK